MNRFQTTLLLLGLTLAGAFASRQGLKDHPLDLFLLGGGGQPEAFRVKASLGGGETLLEPIVLDRSDLQRAKNVLEKNDLLGLRSLADAHGKFQAVLASQGPKWEESLSWYMGGGIREAISGRPAGCIDDLGTLDRIFLALFSRTPDTPPVTPWKLEVEVPSRVTAQPSPRPTEEASRLSSGPLRVEIQNGCGIKGAADWIARRLEGPGLTVVGTGNAPNFRFSKTLVKTAAGRPVALEEAIEKLGLPPESIEELGTLTQVSSEAVRAVSPVDVVVIVGRDFRELKNKVIGHR